MTDSIHPENNDIIQPQNEELNTTDTVVEIDEYDDVQESYDESEEEISDSGNDEPCDEVQSYEDDLQISSDEEADDLTYDSTEKSKNETSFMSNLKIVLASVIYKFSKLDKKKRNKYITIYTIIFVLVVLILSDIIPVLPNSYHRSYVGNQYTVGETGRSASASYRKGVIYANDGSVMCFGPDMKLLSHIDTFSGTPYIRTSGDGAVVYTKNGNKALVMSNEKKQKIVNSDEAIISASVNKKGDYILVTKEAGYTACVSAFNYNSQALYKWHTGNNILDTAISPNGQNIVASVIEYSDTSLYSKLIFLDVASKEPLAQIELNANLALELAFLDDNTVVAIGDSFTTAYTPKGNQKWHIDYDSKLLKTYDVSDDGTIAFLFNRYNSALSESFVEIYNTRGRKVGSYKSPENVRGISLNNDYCLLTLESATVLIDSDGDVKKTKKLTKEYSGLELYQNYNFALGVSNGVVEIVSVRH